MLGLFIFGYLFLIYGLFKFLICYLEIVLTYEQRIYLSQKVSLFKQVLTTDVSTAGRTLSIIYIVFALITIFKAVERIRSGIVHSDVVEIINERLFIYLIYGLLGVLLVILSLIVIYTNISIEKDMRYERRYKLMGICGGLTFIASVPIIYMFHKIFDHGFMNAVKQNVLTSVLSLIFSVMIIALLLYTGYRIIQDDRKCEKKKVSLHEILTLFVIPTNVI
jgi:hypothetical protein